MNVGVLSAKELAAERRLIEASQRDRNRFGQLYERYFDRVYAFAITRTRDRTAAEDVTAEPFRRLPKAQRRVIFMRFVDRRRNREIAQAMGRSEGAVKALQFRALQNLRAWVEEA